jgi:phosphohistidine phosphatase
MEQSSLLEMAMYLLVIRHAAAMDKEEFARTGRSDDERPLTAAGKNEMARIARGLRAFVPKLDALAPSPLLRARQTAAIVARAYRMKVSAATRSLEPDARPTSFARWLGAHRKTATVAVVGHEPHLGALVTWLLTGLDEQRVELKKGGACLLRFDGKPRRASARMEWLLTPAHLRRKAR